MNFDNSLAVAKTYYPDLKIAYKDQSLLMKALTKILFFVPNFGTSYTTTLGQTIYFSSEDYVQKDPDSCLVTLCHELSHIYSQKKKGSIVYSLMYLFPQDLIFFWPAILLFFSILKSLIFLTVLLPLPAYWRTMEERMGYVFTLYSMNKLNKAGSNFDLDTEVANTILPQFWGPAYYFMWWLPGNDTFFQEQLDKIKLGEQPLYDAGLYEMIDDVIKG